MHRLAIMSIVTSFFDDFGYVIANKYLPAISLAYAIPHADPAILFGTCGLCFRSFRSLITVLSSYKIQKKIP
jgi:hypothetical protein